MNAPSAALRMTRRGRDRGDYPTTNMRWSPSPRKGRQGKFVRTTRLLAFLGSLCGGRDALRKYAGGIFLAQAGSKLCLRPGPKAGAERLRESVAWGGGVLERSLPPPRASRGHPPSSEGGKGIVLTTRLRVINRGWRASTARPYGDQTKRHCRGDHWSPVGGTTPFAQAPRRRSRVIVGDGARDCRETAYRRARRSRGHSTSRGRFKNFTNKTVMRNKSRIRAIREWPLRGCANF